MVASIAVLARGSCHLVYWLIRSPAHQREPPLHPFRVQHPDLVINRPRSLAWRQRPPILLRITAGDIGDRLQDERIVRAHCLIQNSIATPSRIGSPVSGQYLCSDVDSLTAGLWQECHAHSPRSATAKPKADRNVLLLVLCAKAQRNRGTVPISHGVNREVTTGRTAGRVRIPWPYRLPWRS